MKTYSISQLARSFGLSRSTLLYYDRIGLLPPSGRTRAGYRQYTQEDYGDLERICAYRNAGLRLSDIKAVLSDDTAPSVQILEQRLVELEQQILSLRNQQHTIVAMLEGITSGSHGPVVNKEMWTKMMQAAGMDERAMLIWHAEFESRAPAGHHEFLLSLGIPEDEVKQIRTRSENIDH